MFRAFRQKESFYVSFFLFDDGVAIVSISSEATDLLVALKDNIHETMPSSPELNEIDSLLENLRVYAKCVKGLPLVEEDYQLEPHR